jgi:nitroreductase
MCVSNALCQKINRKGVLVNLYNKFFFKIDLAVDIFSLPRIQLQCHRYSGKGRPIIMDFSALIEKRRAYRSLASVEIGDEIITALAGAARLAPSCFNNQPWRYVFVYDQEMLNKLHGALNRGNQWAQRASLIIAVFSEPDQDCRIKGRDYFLFDTGTATGFLLLRATELGFVAHPIAGFDEQKVKDVLHIPVHMTVITLVIVGGHADEISPLLSDKQAAWEQARPERLELDEFIYRNEYREG